MIQVWKVDNQGFYVESTFIIEEDLTEFDITTPVNTDESNTFYKPKWNGEKWIEGWTAEEIAEWKEQQNQPSMPSAELLEQSVTELEIRDIEKDIQLTDLEIAIIELGGTI